MADGYSSMNESDWKTVDSNMSGAETGGGSYGGSGWSSFAGNLVNLYASRSIKDVNAVDKGSATSTPGMNGQPVRMSQSAPMDSKKMLIIGGVVVAAVLVLYVVSK